MDTENIDFFANKYNEENWLRFAKCFEKNNFTYDVNENIPQDVFNSLAGLLGVDESKQWITRELKQLDLKTPIELAKTDKGLKALKALIMRMPNYK